MHVHLVLVGALFFTPILGVDPVPGRVSYPFRMLLLFLTLPFHAFLGVTIMGQEELIGGDWYPSLHASMPWLPDPAADQHLAGGILWASGDLIGLVLFGVLFVQWVRASTPGGAARGPATGPARTPGAVPGRSEPPCRQRGHPGQAVTGDR